MTLQSRFLPDTVSLTSFPFSLGGGVIPLYAGYGKVSLPLSSAICRVLVITAPTHPHRLCPIDCTCKASESKSCKWRRLPQERLAYPLIGDTEPDRELVYGGRICRAY